MFKLSELTFYDSFGSSILSVRTQNPTEILNVINVYKKDLQMIEKQTF